MAVMTLREFQDVTHALVERLPEELFTNLNGGISVVNAIFNHTLCEITQGLGRSAEL